MFAQIRLSNKKNINLELYPEVAPNTVNNFISLVQKGFYDNNTFHRLVPGFVLQGGDPEGQGSGGPGYHIKGEFAANGFNNDLKHVPGVLSLARTSDPNSASGQFFICSAECPWLDGQYAAFGRVLEGMDIVDKIVVLETVVNTDEESGE